MTIQVQTESNLKEIVTLIEGIPQQAQKNVFEELTYIAQDIRSEIILSMKNTPKTGRTYFYQKSPTGWSKLIIKILGKNTPSRKRSKPHIASSPGFAPAIDTGELVSRIHAESFRDKIIVGVIAGAPYAEFLENPQSKNRPFLKPAFNKIEPTIEKKIMSAIIASAET